MNAPKIASCPFCGAPGKHRFAQGAGLHWCACTGCEAEGPAIYDHDKAIDAWNRRVDSLGKFLQPLFTRFEDFVTDIAESRFKGVPPEVVRAAQEMLVMTPDRRKRWNVDEWTVTARSATRSADTGGKG